MRCLIIMILAIVLMFVHAGTTMAGDAGGSVVEPYRPEDLAYLDQGYTIPWADAATVAAFVAHLNTYPKWMGIFPLPPRQPWMTYIPELHANNNFIENIKSRAPSLANFKHQLEDLGIDMIFLPIPEGGMIYPDLYWEKIPLDADGLPPQTTEGSRLLLAALDKLGVRYVNLAPAMILARKYSKHGHCRNFLQESDGLTDNQGDVSHWSPYGVGVSAHVVAAEIAKLPWYQSLPKLSGVKAEWVAPKRYGPQDDPRGWQWWRQITGIPKDLTDAPIMAWGDSNMLCGFDQQLMYELKLPVDSFGGPGRSIDVLVRRARENPDWLLKKKLVIWSVANRSLHNNDIICDPVIFPDGIEAARTRAVALAGLPSRIVAVVTLEKNSTAKTPEQWQPYTKALIYGRYRVERSWSTAEDFYMPPYTPQMLMAAGWGLLNGQQTWLTKMKPGTRYQISVESMIDHPKLDEIAVDQDAYEDNNLRSYLITEIKDPDGKPLVDAKGKKIILPQPKRARR